MKSRLLAYYHKEGIPKLQQDLGLGNVMQVPKIEKIVVNVGMGSYLLRHGKKMQPLLEDAVSKIAGQKPSKRTARMSVSNFKLREGMPVGLVVTLRGGAAYDFLDKTINIAFPRVRDFRGISRKSFDKDGNFSIGFVEHNVFPEVELGDEISVPFGLQTTIVTNTQDPNHTLKMLEFFNFPFRQQ